MQKRDIKDLMDKDIDSAISGIQKGQDREKNILSFINKKTRRYISAVYLATDHIGHYDPVRLALRDYATKLIAHSSEFGVAYQETITRLLSLLEVAVVAGLMSPENAFVLRRESYVLVELARQSMLSKEQGLKAVHGELFVDDVVGQKTSKREEALPKKISHNSASERRSARGQYGQDILAALPPGQALSISQIRALLPSIPPKTLQRELAHLVVKGALSKAGSRRWSTYERVVT